ncbi:holin [Gordonia phage Goib]|uniref:Membrane protein n=2 Tax=Vendettavirus vendetta TaxID=2049886 RepID=A0A160DD35_9CAUD|nr:membrane protein [Gordonia phage Vendetta]YP_009275379.1 membrane protein [Gordonia phage Splinter]ANA85572.1 membrane protein [Gordonia phage Vendetta]ANA85651.1 membrane protein [Gordonia phage Splinter]WNO25769.1 holin [Gordonia phage Goib]
MATLKDQTVKAGVLAYRTFWQTLGSVLAVGYVAGFDWKACLASAGFAALWAFAQNMGEGGALSSADTVPFAVPGRHAGQ